VRGKFGDLQIFFWIGLVLFDGSTCYGDKSDRKLEPIHHREGYITSFNERPRVLAKRFPKSLAAIG